MAILVDRSTRVLVQGITGREGSFHTQQMQAYGTTVVAGVVPGRGGAEALGVPVFDTVTAAVAAAGADTAFTIVPPAFAADAVMEAAAAGLRLGVCVTEGIPVLDMVRAAAFVQRTAMRLVGPNCPGLMTPGEAKIGFIPNHVGRPGRVGVVARSGTLTYEVIQGLSDAGHGETTAVGIGGDPVLGSTFVDILPLFAADPATHAVVLVGEIGGSDEERAAEWIRASGFDKPVVAFISGRTAPPGKRMGHAGAIISGTTGSAQGKIDALASVGAAVAGTIEDVVRLVGERLPGS
ncbi:MAG: succinate--CoA ligase subunit alpha [Candidatus Dormibacteria bacterium]|jgi:succinyl-CoA synthetase alpha subunit|nr:succinate--CoA ligase subunit alpha [Chloroflexota bacterium]HBV95179.1 succinate--CoA ligase subunit alpha [Chloroflexota bacterium]